MYPPPQPQQDAAFSLLAPDTKGHKSRHDNWTFRSHPKSQSTTAPFFYQYIFHDGRLPSLTEHHPVRRAETSRPHAQSSQPASRADWQPAGWHIDMPAQQPEMLRSRSLRRKVKHPQLQGDANAPLPPASGTKEKLKRALSLSSVKPRPQPRVAPLQQGPPPQRAGLQEFPPPQSAAPRITSQHFANGSFLVPPTPKITLATPQASPEPTRNSFASSLQSNNFSNFSQGRSSWASNVDDSRDLDFMQHIAQGRLTPSPVHVVERSRDKALARLGITDLPLTPPYTPLPSNAPSIHEQRVSAEWRRPSSEARLDEKLLAMEKQGEKDQRRQEMLKAEQRPKSVVKELMPVERPKSVVKESAPAERPKSVVKEVNPDDEITVASVQPVPMPRPILRRKTSKFTEHLDEAPKPATQVVHFSRPLPTISKPVPKPDHQRAGSEVSALAPRFVNINGPRRSESMRTPVLRTGQWGADKTMVFTAETRSIVAAGSAKLIRW